MTSESSWELFCQPVDEHGRPIIAYFAVYVSPDTNISGLKAVIHKELPPTTAAQISPNQLDLCKPFEDLPFSKFTRANLKKAIRGLRLPAPNSDDEATDDVELLAPHKKLSACWGPAPPENNLHIIARINPDPTISLSSSCSSGISTSTYGLSEAGRLLTRDEKDYTHQIMFNLYSSLWGGGEKAWNSISRDVKVDIPDPLSLDEIMQTTTATFVDLTPLLTPIPPDPKWCIVTTKFLVREEYDELDKYLYLIREKKEDVLLVGQPGIGKTVYLTFSLLRRLISSQPTIYAATKRDCYLFVESGVYWIPGESFNHSVDPVFLEQHQNPLVLFDLNDDQLKVRKYKNWRLLVSSSPEHSRYKGWLKHNNAQTYVMRTWSWSEVFSARELAQIHRSLLVLATAFHKYGGTAGNLFNKSLSKIDAEIDTAIKNCTDIGSLFPSQFGFHDKTSRALIQMNPGVDNHGVLQRYDLQGQIASPYILRQLLEIKGGELADSMKTAFRTLFLSNGNRSASGILFEGAGHRHLFHSLGSPLCIRSLSDTRQPVMVDLRHVQRVEYFDPTGVEGFHELEADRYYQPLSSTNAGIDSFTIERNSSGDSICIVLFQFTTSFNHPINPRFLDHLWAKNTRITAMVPWKLVFVVPLEIETEYRMQRWESAGNTWCNRVSQYVLGVDSEKLWDVLRSPSEPIERINASEEVFSAPPI